ncbi:hypothetical protein Poly24_44250 [Rosistilla carotiformis]|uniref:Uncharacterized protein n=1 Tax=Rosistilla carotiformis TaxID=2528017 RepID=A0A518JYU2_9BACT|nr:hypothetical protein [Rosistilla carotiformis]QDV70699.1 hypothetical protein Poly24_44250 [Rosistilla carotiformis]
MILEQWSRENQWRNEYSAELIAQTHGSVRPISLEVDAETAVVHAVAASYHAVQLAIRVTQSLGRQQSAFAQTQLSLTVDGRRLDLMIPHEIATPWVSLPVDTCQRELTLVG